MTEEEFNKQYDAAVERGKAARAKLLIERANRLQFFVKTFGGHPNCVIETSAYLVLESHQSRRRALWRYFRYALREWRNGLRWSFEFGRRVWWYRYIQRYGRQAAINKACDILEAKMGEGEYDV